MITMMQTFLSELEKESVGTRKMLALVPSDKGEWRPHEKSMPLQDLSTHLADLPTWINMAIEMDELDFAISPYNPIVCASGEEAVRCFDQHIASAIKVLNSANDSILEETWTLRSGEMILMQASRLETIRHSFSQMVHHRAQLGVYLRLLDIPIPGVYGPSADEQ